MRMLIERRRGLTVSLVAAILIGSSMAVPCAQIDTPHTRVDSALLDGMSAGDDQFDVIVRLEAPGEAEAPLSRRSLDGDRLRMRVIGPLVDSAVRRLQGRLGGHDLDHVRSFRLQPAFSATVSRDGLMELIDDPSVLAIEEDRRFPVHTLEGMALIAADELQIQGYSGAGTAVAIIDTGVDYLHPTLGGSVIPNPKVVYGLDTADQDDDPMDCGAHGTAVASVAAGTSYQWNPQRRFAGGVAPEAKILAYKASPDDDCGIISQSAALQAMEDALLHRVGDGYELVAINLSFGSGLFQGPCDGATSSYSSAVSAAAQAGVAVVASAGNDGNPTAIAMPACVGETISVGSVWDTDSGSVPFSFCLDPECTITCNDSFRPAGAVTCYSNGGSTLDVLAPAEYLKAARAHAKTIEFGGTSGAAAYVTGSIALLHEALPDATPGEAGRLLHLSGHPTLDIRSGIVRPRIQLQRMLDQASTVYSSPDTAVSIPGESGETMTSSLQVNQPGEVGSIRILVHLNHPHPENLVIALRAPDGTRARLRDRSPGTIATTEGAVETTSGVWGLFPDEIQPVDSLGIFGGLTMAGPWTLEVTNDAPHDGGPSGVLVGWSLAIQPAAPPTPGSASHTVPVVAKGPGAFDTDWVSDVRVFNPSGETSAMARVFLLPSSGAATWTFRQTDITVPEDSVLDLPDIVASRFAVSDLRGSIRVESASPGLVVTSRTYTGSTSAGTYGQFIGTASHTSTVAVGTGQVHLLQLTTNNNYRTNLGFTELDGDPITLRITLRDGATGAAVGQPTVVDLDGFDNVQYSIGGVAGAHPWAVVEAIDGPGRSTVYASVVDNRTGDAIFVPGTRATSGPLVLPVVARQDGRGDTQWRTDLRVGNLGETPADIELMFRPRRGPDGEPSGDQVTVPAGSILDVEDVVGSLLGLEDTVGSLTITANADDALVAAASRTYNEATAGTFGQFVGAVVSGVGPRAHLTHLGSSPQMRSNIGLCEVAGGSVQVRAVLRDAIGRQIGGSLIFTANAYQLVQVDDVFATVGADPTAVASIELSSISGDGDWVAYASVVDAVTGDAIFVPAVPAAD